MGSGKGYPPEWDAVSLETKLEAGFRCVRCGHPNGWFSAPGNDHLLASSSFAHRHLAHGASVPRVYPTPDGGAWIRHHLMPCDQLCTHDPDVADHRILTVHHLDGVKANLAWWNLAALCQIDHLSVQGRVILSQTYMHPHSRWFMPFAGGYYAATVLGITDVTREEVESGMARFLSAGQPHLADYYRDLMSNE